MSDLQNPDANILQPEETLTLKIFSESDLLLKTVNIKTSLSIDEVVRAIDVNIYRSSLDRDVLDMVKSKIDPLVKLGESSLDLLPVLIEAMKSLKEAKEESQKNYETILQLKKQHLELRSMVLDDDIEESEAN
jgi:hypothetical protein